MFLFTHFVKRFLVVLVHRKNMFSSERSDALLAAMVGGLRAIQKQDLKFQKFQLKFHFM